MRPLIFGRELGPQGPRQGQQARPASKRQAGMGQPRGVRAHRQALGMLGEVLRLDLLLWRRGRDRNKAREEMGKDGFLEEFFSGRNVENDEEEKC